MATKSEKPELMPPPKESPYSKGARAVAYADGASRGNPGPAAYGCVYSTEDDLPLCGEGKTLGEATNNVAEYRGCLAALQRLADCGVKKIVVRLDSQLVVRQMTGQYRVKNEGLKPLHAQVKEQAARFDEVRFEHVPRAQNTLADHMANLALDAAK